MPIDENTVIRILLADRAKLLAYIWSIVHDEHVTEDVFQEVSMLAVSKRAKIRDREALLPWLRRTARYRALHAIRHKGKAPLLLDGSTLDALAPHWQKYDDVPSATLADALRMCVDQLTPYARRIVVLRYIEGQSGIQVAEALGRKVRTIYMALSRIHHTLRDCIRRQQAELGAADG